MYRARIKDGGRHVFAVQIGDEPVWYTDKQKLICWKCDAEVHGKGTYVKCTGASYRAHFALNPKQRHAGSCPFSPVEVITSIAQGAQDLAQVEDGVLKLTLPGDVADLEPALEEVQPYLPPEGVTAQQIATVPPPLPPLLNCAAKIARFLQLNAFDDKAVAHFKVQPHGRKTPVPWGQFCYGPTADAYGALVRRLDPDDDASRPPKHPVAVYGTVQRVDHDRSSKRPFVFLADHADLDGKEFEVVLRSMHPELIKPLTVGTHVLAVGAWKVFDGGRVPQLRLFAEGAWQIAYWTSDEEASTATQPTSPHAVPRPARQPTRTAAKRTPRTTKSAGRRTNPAARRTPPHPTAPSRPTPPSAAAPDGTQQPQPPAVPSPPSPSVGPPRIPPPPPAAPPTAPPVGESAGAAPPVPPRPAGPPRPALPPPSPPRRARRTGLAGWFGRRKKRRS